MKKYFAIMGVALVMLSGLIGYTVGAKTHEDTPLEGYVKAYLAMTYGEDRNAKYDVEIVDVKDGQVYFYWDKSGAAISGYSSIRSIDQVNWNG